MAGRKSSVRRVKLAKQAGWCCYWCSQPTRAEVGFQNTATLEHMVPLSRGGVNAQTNLESACFRCNMARGTMKPSNFAAKLAKDLPPDTRRVHDAKQADLALHREVLIHHKILGLSHRMHDWPLKMSYHMRYFMAQICRVMVG